MIFAEVLIMPLSSLTLGIGVALLQILWNCRFDFINCQLNCNLKVLKTLIIPFCKNTFSVTMPFLYCFIEEFRFKLYTVFTLVAFSITIVSSYGSLFESFALLFVFLKQNKNPKICPLFLYRKNTIQHCMCIIYK